MNEAALLDEILEHPVLYLERPSVLLLESYISGFAHHKASKNPKIDDPIYYGFHDWVAERFKFGHSRSRSSVISFMGGSEQGSFDLLKELWVEYKQERLPLSTK